MIINKGRVIKVKNKFDNIFSTVFAYVFICTIISAPVFIISWGLMDISIIFYFIAGSLMFYYCIIGPIFLLICLPIIVYLEFKGDKNKNISKSKKKIIK